LKSINQEDEPLNVFEGVEEMSEKDRYTNIINVLVNFSDDPGSLKKDYNSNFYKVFICEL